MASISKHRGKWVADFRDRQGKRHREVCRTRKEADALLAARLSELDKGTFVARRKGKGFEELAEAFEKAHKPHIKPNTWTGYECAIRRHLRPYFDGRRLPEITVADIEEFVADCTERGVGVRTVNRCRTILVMMFNYADKHGWLNRNPARHVKKLKERQDDLRDDVDAMILTPEEFQRVLEAAEPPWKLIIKMAGLTGLRQGELLGLRWKNLDLGKREVHVREQYTAARWSTLKSKAARRTVPLPPELVQELREHKLACTHKAPEDVVFGTSKGKPHSQSNLTSRGWKPALRRAEVPYRAFHKLRHTYASALIRNNVSMKVVSTLCGHSSIGITMDTYAHLLPDSTSGTAEAVAATMLGGN